MKKLKTGAFAVTLDLIKGEKYQFRYLLDEKTWGKRDGCRSIKPHALMGTVKIQSSSFDYSCNG